jgi:hypothetical protein
MHWTEYAAIVIVALVAVPFLILFLYIGAIAWAFVRAWWSPEMPAQIGKQFRTEFGIFTRERIDDWSAAIQHRGRSVTVSVDDDEGVPDQTALRLVPAVLAELDELERAARRAVDELTPKMQLTTVSIDQGVSKGEVEVELSFARAEDGDEVLFVDFVDSEFAGWDWVH